MRNPRLGHKSFPTSKEDYRPVQTLSSRSLALLSAHMRGSLPTMDKWAALSKILPFPIPSLQSSHSSHGFFSGLSPCLCCPSTPTSSYPVQNPGLHTKRLATLPTDHPTLHPTSRFSEERSPSCQFRSTCELLMSTLRLPLDRTVLTT